jgi:hypothetical protein
VREQNFGKQPASALSTIEAHVLDSTVAEFTKPSGPLRSATTRDRSGSEIVRFYGDPEDCWGKFAGPMIRRVTGFTQEGRGATSPKALSDRAAAAAETNAAFAALAEKRAAGR